MTDLLQAAQDLLDQLDGINPVSWQHKNLINAVNAQTKQTEEHGSMNEKFIPEQCPGDGQPCYTGISHPDEQDQAHWRCGTVQCGKRNPPYETFTSINLWQNETFPNATPSGTLGRVLDEWDEFTKATILKEKVIEAVDLIITLSHWIHAATGNSAQEYVDQKMRINRLRNWTIQPDGTGRHK
jgi:hypothetical protein